MNGHFAGVGDAPNAEQYGHGVQVIGEEKQYKLVLVFVASNIESIANSS